MSLGYVLTAFAPNLPVFAVVSGLTIGLGSAASFAPGGGRLAVVR